MENQKGISTVLAIIIIIVAIIAFFSPWFYLKYEVVLVKRKIIEETNVQRKTNGLPALSENATLDEVAKSKAYDMFRNQYFDHVSPTGVGPEELAESLGYNYSFQGENLLMGNFISEKAMVQDWMNSPGHRANILNSHYTEIGVSVVKEKYKGKTVWIGVQEFGSPR